MNSVHIGEGRKMNRTAARRKSRRGNCVYYIFVYGRCFIWQKLCAGLQKEIEKWHKRNGKRKRRRYI
jgi:hypothetical protein